MRNEVKFEIVPHLMSNLPCISGEDPSLPGGPGADDQRVEGRAVVQGGRRVPRRHLLLTQVRYRVAPLQLHIIY